MNNSFIMKTLISFIGTNDVSALKSKSHGAVIGALSLEKFSHVILLWNNNNPTVNYEKASKSLKKEILLKNLADKVTLVQLDLPDVTDHNDIYIKLKAFCTALPDKDTCQYTAAISSGTPSMQVCWILLAESGDFSITNPLRLIKITDPKFGPSQIVDVKLNSALPKIIRLNEELNTIKNDLIPTLYLDTKRATLKVGEINVHLSPIELCHFRYFAERLIEKKGDEKFSGILTPMSLMKKIHQYHQEMYPDLELNREDLKKAIKNELEWPIQTFRGNISKINRKLRTAVYNNTTYKYYEISTSGSRGARYYGLAADPSKIVIIK